MGSKNISDYVFRFVELVCLQGNSQHDCYEAIVTARSANAICTRWACRVVFFAPRRLCIVLLGL